MNKITLENVESDVVELQSLIEDSMMEIRFCKIRTSISRDTLMNSPKYVVSFIEIENFEVGDKRDFYRLRRDSFDTTLPEVEAIDVYEIISNQLNICNFIKTLSSTTYRLSKYGYKIGHYELKNNRAKIMFSID